MREKHRVTGLSEHGHEPVAHIPTPYDPGEDHRPFVLGAATAFATGSGSRAIVLGRWSSGAVNVWSTVSRRSDHDHSAQP